MVQDLDNGSRDGVKLGDYCYLKPKLTGDSLVVISLFWKIKVFLLAF